ncbi:MAG: hypothetical protein U0736_12935 [Gemmataceae bacterium]
MSNRILFPLLGLSLLLAAAASPAQDGKAKDPESRYAMDLRVRKAGESDFSKDTKKVGVEVYTDGPSGDGVYLSETGTVSVVPAKLFKSGDGKAREPLFRHGLALKGRPAGEKDWDKARRVGLEVFSDENSGTLVYLSETGAVATVPAKYAVAGAAEKGKPRNPTWKHAMDLKVRKAGEKDFNKDTRKVGVEVFLDDNTGNLVYLTETGGVAVVPSKLAAREDTTKGPTWQHGLELSARRPGEREFTKDTRKYGLEVFLDENNGNLVYLIETGAIAVVPGKFAKSTEGASKAPELKHAMDLSVRKAGEKDFSKDTRKFGVEVYTDENNGNVLYLSDSGDLAVVSPKAE